jgi:gamma-glutamyltranspeptidase/glutathione hydrolase
MLQTADGTITALGSGGSNRIRSAILQVVCALVDGELPLPDAIERPRIHFESGTLNSEGGIDEAARAELQAHCENVACWPERNLFFGGVHAASRGKAGFACYGDPRRGGVAVIV